MRPIQNRIRALFVLLFVLESILTLSLVSISASDSEICCKLDTRDDILPYPLSRGSAVWVDDEDSIYIFGGRNDTEILDRIMKYTPANEKLTFLGTTLPTVLMGSTAVYDGNHVYIFGGKDYQEFYQSILRFDPKTETISNMSAYLPKPTVGGAGVWTGKYIYIFGGCWGAVEPQKFDTILRYDPVQDNITIMNSTLPYGRSGLAATRDDEDIYVIGGSDGIKYSAEIFKYSPTTDTLTTLPATLPTGRKHIQAVSHDKIIYIFGGRNSPTTLLDEIVKFDIETGKIQTLDETLPVPSEFRMHAYDGENIYIIGGFDGPNQINQLIKVTPGPYNCACSATYNPIVDPYWFFGIILLVLVFVIIINLINNYRKKK